MSSYFKNKGSTPFHIIASEKHYIEAHFECFKCLIIRGQLVCKGVIQPTSESVKYTVRIKYDGSSHPVVHVINPQVAYDIKAHMFSDKGLCLYFPKEQPWNSNMKIAHTIIPWTAEWLVYYELYQYCGQWLGPEADHGNNKKENK